MQMVNLIRKYLNFFDINFKGYPDIDPMDPFTSHISTGKFTDSLVQIAFYSLKNKLLAQFNSDETLAQYLKSNSIYLSLSSTKELNRNFYNNYLSKLINSYKDLYKNNYDLALSSFKKNYETWVKNALHLNFEQYERKRDALNADLNKYIQYSLVESEFANTANTIKAKLEQEHISLDSLLTESDTYKEKIQKRRETNNKILGVGLIALQSYASAKNAASLYGSSLTSAQMNTLITSNFVGNLGNSQFYNVLSGTTKVTADNLPSFLNPTAANTTGSGYGFGNQNNNGVGSLNGLNTPSPCSQEQQDEINSQIPNDPKLKAAMYKQSQNPSCMTCAYEAAIAAYEATIRISGDCLPPDRIAAYRQMISDNLNEIKNLKNNNTPVFNLNSTINKLPANYQAPPPPPRPLNPCSAPGKACPI